MYNIDMETTLTQHLITMATQAIDIIQKETATFVAEGKTGYDGLDTDLVTTADIAAQNMYQEYIEKFFPDEGIIGEESLHKVGGNCRYFTIDPLDGTKAFGRKQSMNVGTMIAHVDEFGLVDAVCIGDINTGELYYFGPDQKPTRKRFGVESTLGLQTSATCVSIRKHPEEYPLIIQDLIYKRRGGIYADINIENGSIGIQMARLWKGEVGMIIIEPSFETPWDMTPLVGMHKVLGIKHILLDPHTLEVEVIDKPINQQVFRKNHIELITYERYVSEVLKWIDGWKKIHEH